MTLSIPVSKHAAPSHHRRAWADLFCFPFFSEIAHIYKSNKQKFEATARDWTSKYAM
jgi:hypothetical protein